MIEIKLTKDNEVKAIIAFRQDLPIEFMEEEVEFVLKHLTSESLMV